MPQTIKAVVCAIDFSPFSAPVVDHGVALARRTDVPLYLIHAVHDPQDGAHADTVFERGGDLAHMKHDAKQKIGELMADTGVAWEAAVRFGDPVEQTVDFVKGLPPSLVVSASHGVSGFRRLFIGTVVERLTRALHQPMLVVKPTDQTNPGRFDGFSSAVVSCDRRGCWQRSAPLMPMLQVRSGSTIHLVHAMEGPLDHAMEDADAASYSQSQQAHSDRLHRRLYAQAKPLLGHAQTLTVAVAPGEPQEMVLQAAREQRADVIVVGVRRSGKVGRWISGSTTEALLRRAPCSVLTVPEPMDQGTHRGGIR
ncbi:MAG TPA: universal stress protein [Desulfosarcina sp.]|nr:universal stress protein [Desulfosarcina sp.]